MIDSIENKNLYNIYSIDDKFLSICKNITKNNVTILNLINKNLKIKFIYNNLDVKIYSDNKILKTRNIIIKALYGVSLIKSINVTTILNNYLYSNGILDVTTNIDTIFGNLYIGNHKILFLYTDNSIYPLIIKEKNNKLQSNIIMLQEKTSDILIYLIYHDNKSYQVIEKYKNYDYVKLIFIESTKYFESIIFKYLFENKKQWILKKYVGILTYSHESKIEINLDNIYDQITNIIKQDNIDLITFYNNKYNLYQSFHSKIQEIFDYMLPLFGFEKNISYSNIFVFFSNYWITKPIWMEKYIDFALKFIEKFEDKNDLYLQSIVNSDAEYLNSKAKLSSDKLIQLLGFPHYTHHCFVMERLPSLFFWKNNFGKIMRKQIRSKFEIYKQIDNKDLINKPDIYLIINNLTDKEYHLIQIFKYFKKYNYNTTIISRNNSCDGIDIIKININDAIKLLLNKYLDWNEYIYRYPDLINGLKEISQNNAIQHIISYGLKENRILSYTKPFIVFCINNDTSEYINCLHKLQMPLYWIMDEDKVKNIDLELFSLPNNIIYTSQTIFNNYKNIKQMPIVLSEKMDFDNDNDNNDLFKKYIELIYSHKIIY